MKAGLLLMLLSSVCFADLPTESVTKPDTAANSPSLRSVNLALKPLGWIFGVFGEVGQVGVGRSVTLDESLDFYANSATKRDLYCIEAGLGVTFWLSGDRFQSGWVFSPSVVYNDLVIKKILLDPADQDQTNDVMLVFLPGRYWVWESGFNLRLSAGFLIDTTDSNVRWEPELAFQMGWAF